MEPGYCVQCKKVGKVTAHDSSGWNDWIATCDCYDGAPDSHCITGWGKTPEAAIADWEDQNEMDRE